MQIKVTGWKSVYTNNGLTIYKNQDDLTKLVINVSQNYNSTAWATIRSFPTDYLPEANLYSNTNQGNVHFRIPDYAINNVGVVQYISTSAYNGILGTMFIY